MDLIVSLSEKSYDSHEELKTDDKKFVSFMRECPIWSFFRMSQSVYVNQPHEEKCRLISEYYKSMSKGKRRVICLFVCLFLQLVSLQEVLKKEEI